MLKHSGFTLAELLIALALLGIIAAFTIPKVLQSSAENEKVAKLRETVATLEDAWYAAKNLNQIVISDTVGNNNFLFHTIAPRLNTTQQSATITPFTVAALMDDPGNGQWMGHPCSWDMGYVIFHNGVLIAGLANTNYTPGDLLTTGSTQNTLLCIDVNGNARPNLVGQDIVYGTLNPWGDFDTVGGPPFTPSANGKNFLWGNATDDIYNYDGTVTAVPAEGRVGTWLTR